ncbi:MAG: ATP-dependent helicase, Rep family, partial [Acidobacteria bacterium]|nr:ATP-dependent helicase, Rep family [Acidobacteriota bacterium]
AKSSGVKSNKYAASALRGETQKEKPKNVYTGKTYNNAEAIAEFFNKKKTDGQPTISKPGESEKPLSGYDKLRAISSQSKEPRKADDAGSKAFVPGTHVRHAKYGKGLVLRREGSGDNVKLTVSFPGFGQKKLIEKFANLERA